MNPARINITGGLQNKAPFVKPGMRDGQSLALQDALVIKEQIQIENSWSETNAAFLSSSALLYLLKGIEQGFRTEIRFHAGDTVDEPVLIRHMHGRRPV